MRFRRFILIGLILILCGCSVQIFDLQPIIVGTNTPVPTQTMLADYVTPTPYVRSSTSTPPVHIAPTAINTMVSVYILEITMIDGGTGWSIGQIPGSLDKLVLRTTDGGTTWKNVTPSKVIYDNAGRSFEVYACFRDATHAWVIFVSSESVQEGIRIWYTADGGTTWDSSELPMSDYPADSFTDAEISFHDSQNGWIFSRLDRKEKMDYIGLYITHDGGKTWYAMVTSNSGNLSAKGQKNGAVYRDTLNGWISAEGTYEEPDMVLWRTFDGGNSWQKQNIQPPEGPGIPEGLLSDPAITCSLDVPKFVDTLYTCAWTVLRCSGGSLREPISVLYWSYDHLSSWKTILLPAAEGDLSFYGIEYGWYAIAKPEGADYPYEILYTEDGGENWRTAASLIWDGKLQFITPTDGYGIATFMDIPTLVRTVDGGFNWQRLSPVIVP